MAETRTLNYSWTKPDPGASANTWGSTLNATTDKIDAQMFLNQGTATSGGTYIGFINGYAGTAPPTNWLWCDYGSYAQTAWPALYAIIGTAFNAPGDPAGTFRVPYLVNGRVPVGQGPGFPMGAQGGEATHVLNSDEMPTHHHDVVDLAHYHAMPDTSHHHSITQTAHGHGVTDPQHNHNLSTGGTAWAHVGAGVAGTSVGGNMGDASIALASTGISINGAIANINNNATDYARLPTESTNYAYTGITLVNTGGGLAHNNMPLYCVIGFIIRAA